MSLQKIRIFLSTLIFVSFFFIFTSSAYAASMSAVLVTEPISTPGKIDFDFRVDNPDGDKSWGIYVTSNGGWGFNNNCEITPEFNYDYTNLEASSFGKTMHATCDVDGSTSTNITLKIWNDGVAIGPTSDTVLLEETATYLYASPGFGEIKFVSATRLDNGSFKFLLESGTIAFPVTANLYVQGTNPHWLGGTLYHCSPLTFGTNIGGQQIETSCDLSKLNPGPYTVHAVLNQPDTNHLISSSFDSIGIEIIGAKITNVTRTSAVNDLNPNIFNIDVTKYSAGGSSMFTIKVKDPLGGYVESLNQSQSYTGTGTFTFTAKDYNKLSEGTWTLELLDGAGEVYNTAELPIISNIASNSCQCNIAPAPANCSLVTTTPIVTSNSCQVPAVPTSVCTNPDFSQGETTVRCTCTCVGTPIKPPASPPGGGSPSGGPDYDVSSLDKLFGTLQNVIIAIAVLSGVFIIPYAFVLMASGNPDKIKEGTEWLKSIFWGYLIIFLAGALIRFVGSEILSLGV